MIRDKLIKAFVVCWVFSIGGFFIYGTITDKGKDSRIRHIKKISSDTTFVVERLYPDTLTLPVTSGRLGAFYSCLENYKHISSRRPSKPTDGNEDRAILKLQDKTLLDIRINAREGFFFSLELYDKNNSRYAGSSVYTINCDMALLGKPDSDMHCEDKLLGNEIRPVCTYRPHLSQDNPKG